MRDVTILHRDLFEIIPRIEDAAGTAIYVDPPYLAKGASYKHDFIPEQHSRLANLLRRFVKARVVVSYYDHPLLASLYPDWSRQEIVVTKALSNTAESSKAVEVLLTNERAKGRLF